MRPVNEVKQLNMDFYITAQFPPHMTLHRNSYTKANQVISAPNTVNNLYSESRGKETSHEVSEKGGFSIFYPFAD